MSTTSVPPASISVLFICLGNICRSPMAHAVFSHLCHSLSTPKISIDSAGTGAYHTGDSPDPRTIATLESHGMIGFDHAARQVKASDLKNFDYVIAMDRSNLRELRRRAGKDLAGKVSLFGDWDVEGKGGEIDDPYYGEDDGFEVAYQKCVRFSRGWLRDVVSVDARIDAEGKVTVKKIEEEG